MTSGTEPHQLVPADAQAWDALAISATHDVVPHIETAMDADGNAPRPTTEQLRAVLQQRATSIRWASRLQNSALTQALQCGPPIHACPL